MVDSPDPPNPSDPSFGRQVKSLFDRCVDADPAEQQRLLEQADSPEAVVARVRRMLSPQQSESFALTDAIARRAQQTMGLSTLQAGDEVDHYRLVSVIGHGGQGEVWLAEREDGEFHQRVAIKFLKPTGLQRDLQRFQSERELLASLQHPQIGQLIGGGTYNDDRLYMVLEWINGVPIMDYVRELEPGLTERLGLFRQVCEAVGFAHSNGIIHRDIKPSNILITSDGRVKLIDFGIAKPIDADATETMGNAMLTLAYASPEQINGGKVSTATDIYTLGLLLYELLTGQRAHVGSLDSPAVLIEAITATQPIKPSQRSSNADFGRVFSARRLQGDLDNLVMMALRKEPGRRYPTVQAMIDDVDHFLQSRPLLASGDSVAYRSGKLLRRNPVASVMAGLSLLFMISLPVVMYRANTQIEQQRDTAQAQALLARETNGFLMMLFESASPLGSGGKVLTLEQVLEQGERQIQRGLQEQPGLKASMLSTLGSIQHNLGDTEKAIEYYSQSHHWYRAAGDPTGQLTALGQLAIMHYQIGQFEEARASLQQADQLADGVDDAEARLWHGIRKLTLTHELGDHEQAIALGLALLETIEAQQITAPDMLGRFYNELALSYARSDQHQQLRYLDLALDYSRQAQGEFHPDYHRRLTNKAVLLIRLERHDQAQAVLTRSLEIAQALYSPEHPEYMRVVAEQATLWHDRGQFDLAEVSYRQVITLADQIGENMEANQLYWNNNLAYLYEDQGRLDLAVPLFRKSLGQRREKQMPPASIANAEGNLARVLARTGQYSEARELIERVIAQHPDQPAKLVYDQLVLTATIIEDGRIEAGCAEGLTRIDALLPELEQQSPKSWRRMRAELWIGDLAKRCGNDALSRRMLEAALDKSHAIYVADSIGQRLVAEQVRALEPIVH